MADYCEGVTGNGDHRCLCEEGDLGPKKVTDGSSPAALLHGYHRLGALKPAAFLEKWRTVKVEGGKPKTYWQWPNANQQGFLLNERGDKIAGDIDLEPGTLVDRFGHDDTTYFAPFATPFAMRSLLPSSLNDEYAVYEVKQTLRVLAGPIAPGFEQIGLGTQYISAMEPKVLFDGTWMRKLTHSEVEGLYRTEDLQGGVTY